MLYCSQEHLQKGIYRVLVLLQLKLNITEGFRLSPFKVYMNGLNYSGD